jgi:DnaK suppressor protein
MKPVDLEHFEYVLQGMLTDLERPLLKREGITIEHTPDALDEVQNAAEREAAIRQLEQQSDRFRDVKAAIQRIKEGAYGECLQCGSAISIKRLNAVPWTRYCRDCQDMADQNAVEAKPNVVQLTERGPKTMRAGQSIRFDTNDQG